MEEAIHPGDVLRRHEPPPEGRHHTLHVDGWRWLGASTSSEGAEMGQALLDGKVAVVSGAGEGLGRSSCVALATNGARVVAGDIDADALAATVDAVQAAGGEA